MAALAVAGCGGSSDDRSQLQPAAAGSLRSDLDRIAASVRDGNCDTAEQASATLRSRIDGLGADVGDDLRQALAASADRLDELVRGQCRPASESSPAATPDSTATPDPTQDTSQEERGNKEKQPKGLNKPKQDKKQKDEQSKEVPPGQDGGSETAPPGQQDGDQSPGGDTGGASPDGG